MLLKPYRFSSFATMLVDLLQKSFFDPKIRLRRSPSLNHFESPAIAVPGGF
jgi:hypothetical protein